MVGGECKTGYHRRASAAVGLLHPPPHASPQLDISGVQLEHFPDFLHLQRHLDTAVLSGCGVRSLPLGLDGFANVRVVNLSHNKLHALPQAITLLENLLELDMDFNPLKELSPLVARLTQLRSLSLSGW